MNIQDIKNSGKKAVLFGAVDNTIVRYLMHHGINIEYFVDNDAKKCKEGMECFPDIAVRPVEYLAKDNTEDIIPIISTFKYTEAMEAQLKELGIDNALVAIRDIEDFKDVHFHAFRNKVDIDDLKIDFLHLELSGYCNCKCQYCLFHGVPNRKEEHKAFMTMDILKKTVEKLKIIDTIKSLDIVGNGEVFLNREWSEMTQYVIDELGIENLIMYTNGMLLTEEEAKRIKALKVKSIRLDISIDGYTPEENDCYRVGSRYEIIKNNLLRAKELFDTDSRIRMIITNCYPANEDDINGSNIEFLKKEMPPYLTEDFPNIDKVSKNTFGQKHYNIPGLTPIEIKHRGFEVCLDAFHVISIDASGEMIKCHCFNGAFDVIGNVMTDDVVRIWYENEELNTARNNLKSLNDGEDFCKYCPSRGIGTYYILAKQE